MFAFKIPLLKSSHYQYVIIYYKYITKLIFLNQIKDNSLIKVTKPQSYFKKKKKFDVSWNLRKQQLSSFVTKSGET